jgi:hypothetical protein
MNLRTFAAIRLPRLFAWLTAVALVPALACDSQVGTGYSGEVMLSLQGSVTLADPNATDLVPVLAFLGQDGTNNLYFLVDANVQGQFPLGFRMDVTSPPPATYKLTKSDGSPLSSFKGEMALGYIAAVPRQHPATLPAFIAGIYSDGQGPTGLGPWTGKESLCPGVKISISGSCPGIHQSLECRPASCPVVAEVPVTETFAAALGPVNFLTASALWTFAGPIGFMPIRTTCSADQTCHTDVYSCDAPGPSEKTIFTIDGIAATCSILDVQVDPPFKGDEQPMNAASGVGVMYLTEKNTIPGIGTMGPGYVLIETLPQATPEKEAVMSLCQLEAQKSAGCSSVDIACLVGAMQDTACPFTDHYRILQSPISDSLTLTMAPMTGPM